MILLLSIVSGLASWRLASLLHTEDAFEWLRTWIGIGNDEQGYPAIYPDTFWGNVFHCFWCLSTLVALPVTAEWSSHGTWTTAARADASAAIWSSVRAVWTRPMSTANATKPMNNTSAAAR